jgi:uncharacterized membrane protein
MQPTGVSIPKTQRIVSIDVLRGAVMIIMALDHVRDYFHSAAQQYNPLDLTHTSPAIFLTRWITHFCAPVFVFLAGTSAFLVGERKGQKYLSKFLLTRGLWLIFLEATVVTFGWTFDVHFGIIILQTIWALGAGMIALSLLSHLPKRVLLILALLIIFGSNAFDNYHVSKPGLMSDTTSFYAWLWAIFHDPHIFLVKGVAVFVGYPILAWIGVMATGYCFGELFTEVDHQKRKKILILIGSAAIVLFIVIRAMNVYGDAQAWSQQKNVIFTLMSFINTVKYPPSLLYILMTIGPSILFLAFMEKPLTKFSNVISVYGRVPMFYYLIHIYLIHIASIITAAAIGIKFSDALNMNFLHPVKNYGFNLLTVYCIWLLIVITLYPLCKRYDAYKLQNRNKWWLSYL